MATLEEGKISTKMLIIISLTFIFREITFNNKASNRYLKTLMISNRAVPNQWQMVPFHR